MTGLSKLIRHLHYYALIYARIVFVGLAWKYVFGEIITPLLILLAVEIVKAVAWSIRRYRALRRVGRLTPPTWETKVLRWARAAVELSHEQDDVAKIVGYRSRLWAWLLTTGQALKYAAVVTYTCLRHYVVTVWRVAEVRRQWDVALASKRANLTDREKRVPFLSDPKTTVDLDVEAFVKPTRLGFVIQDVADITARIAEVVGCREMTVTPGDKIGVGLLKFYWTDPLSRLLGIREMPVEKKPNTVAYGIRRNGDPATFDIDKSLLIGGLTGTGKSSLMWAAWASIIRSGTPVRLWVSDPKGGMELEALERSLGVLDGTFQVVQYVRNSDDTTTLVNKFEAALRERQKALRIGGPGGGSIRRHVPTDEFPQNILILDELLPLVEMLRKGTSSNFGKALFEGRAAGFTVWANTQVGHADSLGTSRNLFPTRVCLGMPTSQATDTILGDGSEGRGAKCSMLGRNVKRNAGLGWSINEEGRLAPFRVAFVSDEAIGSGPSDVDVISTGQLPDGMLTSAKAKPLAVGETKKVAVYRVYGEMPGTEGLKLIYVGISNAPALRFDQHRDRDWTRRCSLCPDHGPCWWWRVHVDPHRADPERCPEPTWYPDRATALKVEKAAIEAELPVMNKVHNQGNPLARRVRARVAGGKDRRFAARSAVTAPEPDHVDPERPKKRVESKPANAKVPRAPKARPPRKPHVKVPREPKAVREPRPKTPSLWPLLIDRLPARREPTDPKPSQRRGAPEPEPELSYAEHAHLTSGTGWGAE